MKLFFKYNWFYLFIYLIILFFLGYILLRNGKVQIHEAINKHVGNSYVDFFFKYITHLGDGLLAFIIIFILLFISMKKSLYILLSYLSAAMISTLIKYIYYPNIFRPHSTYGYFLKEKKLILVDGVIMSSIRSFPSGHALSAFALFFCLLFMTKNHGLKILYFLLAVTASFSRVYISQHWLIDIYAGSIIGTVFSVLFYFIFYNRSYAQNYDTTLPLLILKNKQKRV